MKRLLITLLIGLAAGQSTAQAQEGGKTFSYQTENFSVTAGEEAFAREVAEAAERLRRELAERWFGRVLPNWSEPCKVQVLGPAGHSQSKFTLDKGKVWDFTMELRGSREKILVSMLPHEVCHCVFITHFGRAIPRWADEGVALLVEDRASRDKELKATEWLLNTGDYIPTKQLLEWTEYPDNKDVIRALYAQSCSLVAFLVEQPEGEHKLVALLEAQDDNESWDHAFEHFGFSSITALQSALLTWMESRMALAQQ